MTEARPVTPTSADLEIIQADSPMVTSLESDEARIERARCELEMGFEALGELGLAVSIFGSARTPRDHPRYALARETARLLGEAGFAIITGGGPGLMEAANRGARDAGVRSVGLRIELPFEQGLNEYVDLPLIFHYFYTRKLMFVRYACAFAVLPGGFGTLDEMFEALTLVQTGRAIRFPILLLESEHWRGLVDWLREQVLGAKAITPADLDLLELTDSPERVVAAVREAAQGLGISAA